MNNTIILRKGYAFLTKKEYESFEKGDTIFGANSDPEELKRWSIEEKDLANKELEKYSCSYFESNGNVTIEEYALEMCECDEDGEFVEGSDFDLAK